MLHPLLYALGAMRLFWREEILRLRSTAGAEAFPQPIPAGIVCGESVEDLSACDHTAASMAPADVPLSPSRSEMRRTVHRVIAKNASNRGSAASARTSCTKRRAYLATSTAILNLWSEPAGDLADAEARATWVLTSLWQDAITLVGNFSDVLEQKLEDGMFGMALSHLVMQRFGTDSAMTPK